jgi:hypothetical protein
MDRSLAVALGVAAIAHAFVIGVVRPRVRQDVAPPVNVVTEIELVDDLWPLPSGGGLPDPPPQPAPHVAINIGKTTKSKETVTIDVPPASSGEIAATPPTTSPSGEAAPKVAAKIPSLINLDSPGSHAVIWPSSSPSADGSVSKEKAAAAKLDSQIKSMLDAKDTETGSGFGGPVVSAAHAAASPSGALGYATFDVSTDALGKVTLVRVVDFGGDSKSWQNMAKDIHAQLGSTRLKVPTGAAGVSVRIRVEAAMKYPSGATTPISPMVGAGSVGGSFDVADLGQPKRRMVNVRIVSESRI